MPHKLSVIIPAYRQAKTIVRDVKRIEAALQQIRYPHEIIVIVDGYGDGTYRALKRTSLSRHIKATVYMKNQGKGYAVRHGMERATGDYIAFIDAGMEIDPNGISMLLEHMVWYNADVIVGSKRHPVSMVAYPPVRRVLSFIHQFLARFLFRLKVRDTQAGLKVFKRKVLKKVLPRLLEKRYAFDLEILSVAYRLGFRRIYEAPIKLKYRLEDMTHAASLKTIYFYCLDVLAIFYRLYILNYYDDSRWVRNKPKSLRFPFLGIIFRSQGKVK